jgi:hypothetical protein
MKTTMPATAAVASLLLRNKPAAYLQPYPVDGSIQSDISDLYKASQREVSNTQLRRLLSLLVLDSGFA